MRNPDESTTPLCKTMYTGIRIRRDHLLKQFKLKSNLIAIFPMIYSLSVILPQLNMTKLKREFLKRYCISTDEKFLDR